MEGKNWYALHVTTGFERHARDDLLERISNNGMADRFGEILLPTEKRLEVRRGKNKELTEKVFPRLSVHPDGHGSRVLAFGSSGALGERLHRRQPRRSARPLRRGNLVDSEPLRRRGRRADFSFALCRRRAGAHQGRPFQ